MRCATGATPCHLLWGLLTIKQVRWQNHTFAITLPKDVEVSAPALRQSILNNTRANDVLLSASSCMSTICTPFPARIQMGTDGSFELSAPIYDIDIRDIQTRQLRVGLSGGERGGHQSEARGARAHTQHALSLSVVLPL